MLLLLLSGTDRRWERSEFLFPPCVLWTNIWYRTHSIRLLVTATNRKNVMKFYFKSIVVNIELDFQLWLENKTDFFIFVVSLFFSRFQSTSILTHKIQFECKPANAYFIHIFLLKRFSLQQTDLLLIQFCNFNRENGINWIHKS